MRFIDTFSRSWVLRLLALLVAGFASAAMATNVRFVGSVGYSAITPNVILNADKVQNFAASGSAPLRMELWATPTAFAGSFASGYKLAQYSLGSLAAGASLTNVSSGVVPYTDPPAGLWYVAMVLTEYTGATTNDGYTPDNYVDFPTQIGSGPPADSTPPTVSISSPTGGSVSGTVTVTATASDNVGVTRVFFYVNGVLASSDTTAPYQYSWNTTALPDGSVTLRARAYDAAGNWTDSANVTVRVANSGTPPPDTTPPTVNISSPTGGNVSGTVTVSASAADNVGVARVDFYVNGAKVGSDSTSPYQYSWNTTTLPNGAATLSAMAYDAAGNKTQEGVVTVNVANPDTTPPTVGITAPTGGNVSGTVTVSANASDNVGVTRVDFYVNGAKVGSGSTAPYQYSWDTTTLPNGAATLQAVAFDAAGNSTQSAIVTVDVANSGVGASPLLQTAVSRRVHGSAGTFDLALSLVATNPTTEPRQGPVQTIVFAFDKAISGASAAVTEGTATAGAPAFSGSEVIVPLTGVADQQYVTVSLTNVTASDGGTNGSGSVRLGFLVGDVNGNRIVTVADVGLVNAQLAQPVTAANFVTDVNVTGTITIADKSIATASLTKALPAP